MELQEAIYNRKSIRSFSNKNIDDNVIKGLVNAAIYAPSASNKQAWKFIIISDNEIKKKICLNNGGVVISGGSNLIEKAPIGILVLYRKDTSRNYRMYKDHIQSAAAAVQNLLLKAYEEGLGACWICKLSTPSHIRKLLKIPSYYDVIAYVALGYPSNEIDNHTLWHFNEDVQQMKKRSRKYSVQEVISHNKFTPHKNCTGTLRNRYLLSILHHVQLLIKNDGRESLLKMFIRYMFYLCNVKLPKI